MSRLRSDILFYPYFENFMPLEKPPTLYAIMESIVNYDRPDKVRILDLSAAARPEIFDFGYTLSTYINKEEFEIMFLDHFMERRIGAETVTAFKLHLRSRIREIMPRYNIIFDALGEKFDIYQGDGYTKEYSETETEGTATEAQAAGTSDRRYSDTPQNALDNVQSGLYMTDYTYTQDDASNKASTDRDKAREYKEIYKTNLSRLDALLRFNEARFDLYQALYRECDDLFYQLF